MPFLGVSSAFCLFGGHDLVLMALFWANALFPMFWVGVVRLVSSLVAFLAFG